MIVGDYILRRRFRIRDQYRSQRRHHHRMAGCRKSDETEGMLEIRYRIAMVADPYRYPRCFITISTRKLLDGGQISQRPLHLQDILSLVYKRWSGSNYN